MTAQTNPKLTTTWQLSGLYLDSCNCDWGVRVNSMQDPLTEVMRVCLGFILRMEIMEV
jgi:hypothetical protein